MGAAGIDRSFLQSPLQCARAGSMECGDGVGRGGGVMEIVDLSCRRGVYTLFPKYVPGPLCLPSWTLSSTRLSSKLHYTCGVGKNLLDFCPLLLLGVKKNSLLLKLWHDLVASNTRTTAALLRCLSNDSTRT